MSTPTKEPPPGAYGLSWSDVSLLVRNLTPLKAQQKLRMHTGCDIETAEAWLRALPRKMEQRRAT